LDPLLAGKRRKARRVNAEQRLGKTDNIENGDSHGAWIRAKLCAMRGQQASSPALQTGSILHG
jgi:hypothetical protein